MHCPTDHLKRLGLSAYEAAIYGALLERSPASAATIAKACALSRSTVYTCLHALIGKGIVNVTQKNGVKQFLAEDVEVLDRLLQVEERALAEKRAFFQEIGPQLRALGTKDAQVPRVVFFEGQEGLKRAYMAMMRQAPVGATLSLARDPFVWQPEWGFVFESEWRDRIKRLKTEKRLTTRLLVNGSAFERKKSFSISERRALRSVFSTPRPPCMPLPSTCWVIPSTYCPSSVATYWGPRSRTRTSPAISRPSSRPGGRPRKIER